MRIINNNINSRVQPSSIPNDVNNIDIMTYEEIINLTERVGVVSKGLSQKQIDVSITNK